MTNAFESLSEFVTSSKTKIKSAAQAVDRQSFDVLLSRTNKSGAPQQKRLRKLKLRLPIAALNSLTSSLKRFRQGCASASETVLSELKTKCFRWIDETINN